MNTLSKGRLQWLPAGVLAMPEEASEGEAIGSLEVEWTLAVLEPLISAWPESPADLIVALGRGADPASAPSPPPAGAQPKLGYITAFPLYCGLWAQPAEPYETAGRIAQAAALVSAAILARGSDGLAPYLSALRSACLSSRRIGRGAHVPAGLIDRLAAARSLASVLNALDSAKQVGGLVLTPEQHRLMAGLHVLLEDAIKSRAPRIHRASSATRVVRRSSGSAEVDDPTPEHSTYEDLAASLPSSEDVEEGAASVRESPTRRIVAIKVPTTVPATSLSPGQFHWRARLRSRAIATSAQGLLLASDRLQLVDLAAAERAIADIQCRRWRPRQDVIQGIGIASASLLSGRSVDQLKKLRVVPALTDLPDQIKHPYLAVSEQALVVPGPTLVKPFVPTREESPWYRPTHQKLVLPLPSGLSWTQWLLEIGQNNVGKEPFDGSACVGRAEEFARAVNQRSGSRLTVPRIAQFLTRQVVAQCGDWADAALLTGSGSANARLYYYAPTHAHLRARYDDLWRGIGNGLGKTIGTSTRSGSPPSAPPADAAGPASSSVFFGSQGCPTDEGVATMVAGLLDHCRTVLRGRRSPARRLLVHNAIATYTCVMVLWHSGMRAVADPVELELYDPRTGTLGASDKDNDSYYASRVVWLPGLVQRQILAYWRHLDGLRSTAPVESAEFGKRLFLFDADGVAVPVTVKALRQMLPSGYPFRMNSQRHFLRTRLRELEVPAQTIDALLGHGAPGQEPYAAHSCYSVQRLQREIEPALRHLSEKAGWLVLDGLAA